MLDRFSRQSSRKQSDDLRNLLQTQLYVQQHQRQFNKSSDGSSPSLDIIGKSTSNSDIEEILDEPDPITTSTTTTVEQVIITEADGTDGDGHGDGIVANELLLKPKRPILTGMTLTESSSSGSVTDSVCTAYENQTTDTKIPDQTITVNMAVTATTPAEQESIQSIDDDLDVTAKTEETSTISTLLGGKIE